MHNQQPLRESTEGALTTPSLIKLGASFVYDSLVVMALCFALALLQNLAIKQHGAKELLMGEWI